MSSKRKGLNALKLLYESNRDNISSNFLIEIRGRGNLTVRGCKKVLHYSEKRVCLRLSKDIISITGDQLRINTYYTGVIQICGRISDLNFGGNIC